MPQQLGQFLGGDLGEQVREAEVPLTSEAVGVSKRQGEHDAGDELVRAFIAEAELTTDAVDSVGVGEESRLRYGLVGKPGCFLLPLYERLPVQAGVGFSALGLEGGTREGGLEAGVERDRRTY